MTPAEWLLLILEILGAWLVLGVITVAIMYAAKRWFGWRGVR